MQENRFFRFVWRFNAVVLMIVGILAIVLLGFGGYQIFEEILGEEAPAKTVDVGGGSIADEKWRLGQLQNIEGSPYVMIPLFSDQGVDSSYSSKASSTSSHNLLFINCEDNQKRWLFPANDFLVVRKCLLPEGDYFSSCKRDQPVKAILYQIAKKDTNGDGRLTENDEKTVALSLPSGLGYKEILHDVDVFVGQKVLDEETLLIVFQKQEIGYSVNVSLKDFSLSEVTELPKVGG